MVMQNAGGEEGGYSKQVWGFWSGDCGDRCSILNRLIVQMHELYGICQ